MSSYLLDTNIISLVMRGDETVTRRIRDARRAGAELILSPLADYEVVRGLLRRKAAKSLALYETVREGLVYTPFDELAWRRSAELWAHTRTVGYPIPDADLLLAAQAIELGAVFVTDNERHFEVFKPLGLTVENWKQDVPNG